MGRLDERDLTRLDSDRTESEGPASAFDLSRENAQLKQEIARLRVELQQNNAELRESNRRVTEALEQQTATAEIHNLIASSTTDAQPVLNAVAERAARLCDTYEAIIHCVDGDVLPMVACYPRPDAANPLPPTFRRASMTMAATGSGVPIQGSFSGRAVTERRTIHIHDSAAVSEEEYPVGRAMHRDTGQRTILTTPLLRHGVAIGAILLRRLEVRPFTEEQVRLLESFADQAVIAIENARLFSELEQRNAQLQESNRRVTEALEQQTATAEVLRVIASSPTALDRVFRAVAKSAVRLCDSSGAVIWRVEQDALRIVAVAGEVGGEVEVGVVRPISAQLRPGRVILEGRIIQTDPEQARTEFPENPRDGALNPQTIGLPMLRDGVPIGVISVGRRELRRFSEQEIALLQTFADQAIIAIENARLFEELEQRTAQLGRSVDELHTLATVSEAVSSSLDLERVLTTIVSNAVRLAGGDGGTVYELDETAGAFELRASYLMPAELLATIQGARPRLSDNSIIGRAGRLGRAQQIPDLATSPGEANTPVLGTLRRTGFRALLAVPLVSDRGVVGMLVVRRRAPGAFPAAVVELLQAFASQSVLAIQNAQLFQALDEKSRALEVASRHKSDFLANMSHELRTPLNSIIGFSEILLEGMLGALSERQDESVQDILASGQHLLSLINDILDLSKVEAGRMELELTHFRLSDVLEQGRTMLKERALRHHVALDLTVDPTIDVIEADERKVKQVVVNLISNAVKFTPDGGRVKITERQVHDEILVAIRDSGVGIAPEDQERIFEEFHQVGDGAARREGTGLGLALVRRLVELHGGRIWGESELGAGSTFTFALPLRPRSGAIEPDDRAGARS